MTSQEVFEYLTGDAGLSPEEAQLAMKMAANPKVATKAAALKQQSEYDAIATAKSTLEAELVGDGTTGARAHKQWYKDNFPKIQKLQEMVLKYTERYGALDGNGAVTPPAAAAASGLTEDAAVAAVRNKLGPEWSNYLVGQGKILERHLRSKRTKEIDWAKVGELAVNKGGDLVAAYDEWAAPDVEAERKVAEEARIEKRVKEELARRNTQKFTWGGDSEDTHSDISPLSKQRTGDGTAAPKYDRSKVIAAAVTGLYDSPEK